MKETSGERREEAKRRWRGRKYSFDSLRRCTVRNQRRQEERKWVKTTGWGKQIVSH